MPDDVIVLLARKFHATHKFRKERRRSPRGKRVCGISRIGNIFQADFSFAQSSLRCLLSQSSSELGKWHRRFGHLSFNLLCQLSGLGLLRGLPLLKFESNLVCSPCHHGKMIAASHSPINTIMIE
jgi:hypothetical protein